MADYTTIDQPTDHFNVVDYTGNAMDKCMALAFGIGCGHAFETTFQKRVYCAHVYVCACRRGRGQR